MSRARDLADRVLHNRTHEDIEGGRESIVTFKGEQSGGEISTLAQIQASHDGTSDDQKADLIFKTNDGSDGASPTERMKIDSNGSILTSTLGTDNVHLGEGAGVAIVSGGNQNTLIGKDAGAALTTGDNNVAVGFEALKTEDGDGNNVAVGYQALKTLNAGANGNNTAIGYATGNTISTGTANTLMGAFAGDATTTGERNIILGAYADASSATANGECVLGDSNISTLRCNTSTISALSDARDKTEVEPSPLGVDFLNKLNPVKFLWDSREGNSKDGTYEIGFIAQELQEVQKESNTEYLKMVIDENPDRLEASYGQLVPILVQAIKELSTQVKQLQTA